MIEFAVDVDIIVSKRIYVDAENEKQAMEIVNDMVSLDPYSYAKNPDAYVCHKIMDVNEET